jgi:hypothetical protein
MKKEKKGKSVTVSRTTAGVLAGEIDVTDWDDDEIMRGNRRGKDGRFHGRKPRVVAQAVHEERHRRFFLRGMEMLRDNVHKAVEYLNRVIQDESVPHSDRIKAATFVIERIYGKAPERVALDIGLAEPPWLAAIKGSIIGVVSEEQPSALPEGEVIDAEEIIEEEDKPRAPARPKKPEAPPQDSRVEQIIEPSLPRVVPIGREPKRAASARDRRMGRE